MNQKSLKLLALLVVLLLVATACGGGQAPTTGGGEAAAPTVEKQQEAEHAGNAEQEAEATATVEEEAPAAGEETAATTEGEPYKIGVFFSVTGPASSLGVPERDTAMMLVEQVNGKGGLLGPAGKLHPIELTLEDDQTDSSEAGLIVKKLVEDDNVPVIVGGTASGVSLAVMGTVTEA